ncbi:vWA domain-containing protein [Celeribacter naphthalenivorans]|uniref:vWA domain-containing protein n=1 Tax=Celeribacter naphthalenivorans TaxID=1614694 RepID=UPI001CFA99AD|nr:VWA domain-containing protein [Celeribacter naphthalenivorans]
MKTIWAGAAILATLVQGAAAQDDGTVIVMDGSGSMWGQIDGRPKLEIAKEALAEVLQDVPPGRELGLLAYGHRRKGDCGDIELLVPPAPGTVSEVLGSANTMRFLGKTPLTEAVRQAAIGLRSTEEAATVILITDGIETCEGDPCALARELEAGGVDFTAHVVGFGLSREEGAALSCLATETGGRYIEARDATALRTALNQTIASTPAPETTGTLPPAPMATLDATETAGRATAIDITWTGPARAGDYIDIAPFDGAGTHSFTSAPVTAGEDKVTLTLPADLGTYVLRYVQPLTEEERASIGQGRTERTLALRDIAVVDIDKFLDAPDVAGQGATISVAWGGPAGAGDFIGIYHAGASGIDPWLEAYGVDSSSPVSIHMPLDPGSYELRYIVEGSDGDAILVTEPVTISAAQITFNAPDTIRPGATFPLGWSGPGGPDDWIDIVDTGTDGVYASDGYSEYSYAYTKESMESREATLTAPEAPGSYEIRYIGSYPSNGRASTSERLMLFRQAITVSADAPDWSLPVDEGESENVSAASMDDVTKDDVTTASETPDRAPADEPAAPSDPQSDAEVPAPQDDIAYFCEEAEGCVIEDAETGVGFFIRYGWATDLPYHEGPEAPVRINFFDTRTNAQVALNAPADITDGLLCLPSTVGTLCNLTPDDPSAMIGMTTLIQTLKTLE